MAVERKVSENTQSAEVESKFTDAGAEEIFHIEDEDTEKGASNVKTVPHNDDDDFEFTFGKFMAMLVSIPTDSTTI